MPELKNLCGNYGELQVLKPDSFTEVYVVAESHGPQGLGVATPTVKLRPPKRQSFFFDEGKGRQAKEEADPSPICASRIWAQDDSGR
jgi:hypothetical protein